jgi:hypothetical protein
MTVSSDVAMRMNVRGLAEKSTERFLRCARHTLANQVQSLIDATRPESAPPSSAAFVVGTNQIGSHSRK